MGTTNTRSDPVDAACRLHEAAVAYRGAGRLGRAQAACRRSLALLEQAVGPDHLDVANVLNTLVMVLHDCDRYDEAEALARCSVGIMETILPDDEDLVRVRVQSLRTLAGIERLRARYAEAETLSRRALHVAEHSLGGQDRQVAVTLNDLGIVHKAQGRYREASRCYRRALAIFEGALGPDDLKTLACRANLRLDACLASAPQTPPAPLRLRGRGFSELVSQKPWRAPDEPDVLVLPGFRVVSPRGIRL
jgi:kinesin light chain